MVLMKHVFVFVHSDRRFGRWWTRGFLITDRVWRGVFFVGRMARTKDEDERRVLAVGDADGRNGNCDSR